MSLRRHLSPACVLITLSLGFPPRRLGAEEIRDTLLATAGQLKLEPMGGPGFRLYRYLVNNVSTYIPLDTQGPETYRRAVYHQNARASVVDILNDFDLPDIAFASPKRANTTSIICGPECCLCCPSRCPLPAYSQDLRTSVWDLSWP